MKLNGRCHFLTVRIALLITLIAALTSIDGFAADKETKRVFVLHSYNLGYPFSDNERFGIDNVFSKSGIRVESYVTYMDMKRIPPTPQNFAKLKELIREGYKDVRFDAFLVCDNDALEFMRKYRDELFPDVPLVFTGINDFNERMLDGRKDVTGTVESADYAGTITVALKLRPKTKSIVVVTDNTTTGKAHISEIEKIRHNFPQSLNFITLSLADTTLDGLAQKLSSLENDSIVLLVQHFVDKDGNSHSLRESALLLAKSSSVPVFVTTDSRMGLGVLGGHLIGGVFQGESAAETVVKILKGTDISTIHVILKSPNKYMFDYTVMKRFGISEKDLPDESFVINKPFSILDNYRPFLSVIIAVFILLSGFVVYLQLEIRKRRKVEEEIKTLNYQLEERIRERTAELEASNQSLQENNDKVLRISEEIRESRQQLLDIIDFIPDATFVINNDKKVIVWNSAMERMTGISKEKMLGQGDYAYTIPFYGERRENLLDLLDEDIEDLGAKYQNEMRGNNILTAEAFCPALNGGKGAFVWAAAAQLFNIKGERVGYIESIRDITDRRQAQDALKQANQEMESFAYSVSHDLRAPLRSIDGFSLALLEECGDKLDEDGKDYLRRVRAATQRMAQLIDDMLKLSRITRSELNYETVNLSDLAVSVADELRAAEPERKVKFVIKNDVTIKGDSRLLKVVLDNLLGNAWKFTGSHAEARIEFGLTNIEGKTAYFVRDDGAGFDMNYADKLFITFQRLHSELEFTGTGIGLTLVQHIIHRHGGTVWAEGAVEQGATFWFTVGG